MRGCGKWLADGWGLALPREDMILSLVRRLFVAVPPPPLSCKIAQIERSTHPARGDRGAFVSTAALPVRYRFRV